MEDRHKCLIFLRLLIELESKGRVGKICPPYSRESASFRIEMRLTSINPMLLQYDHSLSLPTAKDLPDSDDTPVDNELQDLIPGLLKAMLALIWSKRISIRHWTRQGKLSGHYAGMVILVRSTRKSLFNSRRTDPASLNPNPTGATASKTTRGTVAKSGNRTR